MSGKPVQLHEFFYVSRIAASVPRESIAELVIKTRLDNQRLGITGCLVFAGEHLAQIIEGPSDVVHALLERIAHDPRHRDFRVLRSQSVAQRRLPRWSMRFLLRENVEQSLSAIAREASMKPRRVDELISTLFTDTHSAP